MHQSLLQQSTPQYDAATSQLGWCSSACKPLLFPQSIMLFIPFFLRSWLLFPHGVEQRGTEFKGMPQNTSTATPPIDSNDEFLLMGYLHICEGTINVERYMQVLEQHMLQSRCFFRDVPAYFTPHSAGVTAAWLHSKNVGTRTACLQSRPVSHWKWVALQNKNKNKMRQWRVLSNWSCMSS